MDLKDEAEDKRIFFRLELYRIPIQIRVTDVMSQPIIKNMEYKGWIKNISGGGISFYVRQKMDVEEMTELTLHATFELMKRKFEYPIHITRYVEENPGEHLYSCRFIFETEQEQSNLAAVLLRMDARRSKK